MNLLPPCSSAPPYRSSKTTLTLYLRNCLLDIDPNLFFLPPARRGKVLQGASHRLRRRSAFSVRVVKYWNKVTASVVTAPFVNVFKKRLEKFWTEAFPISPIDWTLIFKFPTPPSPSNQHSTHYQLSSLYATQMAVLYMWFLQARCGLLFTITNILWLLKSFVALFPITNSTIYLPVNN